MATLKQLLALFPPVTIYHILRESVEFERNSRKDIEHVAIGWKPDDSYQERIGPQGQTEYFKVVRKGK